MTLARAWRRQLYGASSVALIVPSALLAALVVLALGGGFSGVGVLGQIFAGPPAPSVGGGASGHAVATTRLLPSVPSAAIAALRPGAGGASAGAGARHSVVPMSSAGTRRSGGAIAPVGGAAPIGGGGRPVGGGSVPRPAPSSPAPTRSTPPATPSPQPQPTPIDRIVNTVTPVTHQLPAPTGPAATQAVQAAGSAADGVLAPGSGSPAPGSPGSSSPAPGSPAPGSPGSSAPASPSLPGVKVP